MYLVTITSEDFLQATHFNSIETTQDEDRALRLQKGETIPTLEDLRRMGFDPLLIKVPEYATFRQIRL